MEIKLQKWGNSDGIRIPSSYLKSLNIKTNDKLEIYEENDKIIISKPVKKHISLKERINEYNKLPKSMQGGVETYDWQGDQGLEKWD